MIKRIITLTGMTMFLVSLLGFGTSFADDGNANENAQLRSLVSDLTKKVDGLENKLANVESKVQQPGQYVSPTAENVPAGGLVKAVRDIQMGGYVDTQFNGNMSDGTANQYVSPTGTVANKMRVFDHNQNTFTLNAAKLWFQKLAEPEGGAGFRIDLLMGEDARLIEGVPGALLPGATITTADDGTIESIDSTTIRNDFDNFAIEQAYVEANLPLHIFDNNSILPHVFNVKMGRFVTLAGAEVIEGPANWNISRSMMFGFAIPFAHTGVRTNAKFFNDFFDVYLGVNNGWDNAVDNNDFKTLEYGLGFSPIKNVKNFSSVYFGPETDLQSGHKRFLLTNVTTWDATDKLSFMADFNWGNQNRVIGLKGLDQETAQWWGMAYYARYKFTQKFSMAGRFEYFNDNDTFRAGFADNVAYWSPTITAEYIWYENLISRLEYRLDKANTQNVFAQDNSSQSTIAAQLIYLFQ